MLDAARDDQELAFVQPNVLIAELDQQASFDDEKHLVFVVVLMPDELALELRHLDVHPLHFADDLGRPRLAELS